MTIIRLAQAASIASVCLFAATQTLSAQCPGLSNTENVGAGDVVVLDKPRAILPPLQYNERPRIARVRLGIMLAPVAHEDGTLIVKWQHFDEEGKLIGANDWVELERPGYVGSCTKIRHRRYAHQVPWSKYLDYHFYNAEDFSKGDDNLDRFHAEVGMRDRRGWFTSSKSCMETNSRNIKFHLLFDDAPRLATLFERLGRIFSDASNSLKKSDSAIAARPSRSPANAAHIIPYGRNANELACIPVSVPVPSGAKSSKIMIVDADEAATTLFDPQRTRTIKWVQR